jgi:hypothetical protein
VALSRETLVDDRVLAQGLMMAGAVAGIDHRFDGILDLLDEARRRFEAVGSVGGTLWTGYWSAATLAELGDLEAARSQIEETATAAAEEGMDGLVEGCPGGPDRDALASADRALIRARHLTDAHGVKELSARVGLSQLSATQDPAAVTTLLGAAEVWAPTHR